MTAFIDTLIEERSALVAKGDRLAAKLDILTTDDEGTLRSLSEDEAGEAKRMRAELVTIKADAAELRDRIAELDGTAEARRQAAESGALRGGAQPATWADEFRAATEDRAIATSGALLVSTSFRSEPVADPRRARFVTDLFVVEDEPTGVFAYLRQTVRTNNAAPVADGALKPTSVYTLTQITGKTEVIAHLSQPIPVRWLEANSSLERFLDAEMRYGLDVATAAQVLSGTGVSPQTQGLYTVAGSQSIAYATSAVVTTRKALTAFQIAGIPTTCYVFHPSDWETIDLAVTPEVAGGPISRSEQLLHGVPVVLDPGATVGLPLLLDASAVKIKRTGGTRIEWSSAAIGSQAGVPAFQTNEVVARAEHLVATAIEAPARIAKIDITSA